jgi:hypothetical protein
MEGSIWQIATKLHEVRCHAEQSRRPDMPSTVIRDFSYDPETSELWITFVSGRRYVYAGVPQDTFDAFKAAPSRGAFFNHEIRDNYLYCEAQPQRRLRR